MSKVIVVGGGPSGMMAALTAAKNNHEVTLIERNDELGKKLKLTGGGRCNITNYRYIEEFFDKVVTNKKFLYSAFYSFTNEDLLNFLSESNLEYKVEKDCGQVVCRGRIRPGAGGIRVDIAADCCGGIGWAAWNRAGGSRGF